MDQDTEGSPFDRSEVCPLVLGREAGKRGPDEGSRQFWK